MADESNISLRLYQDTNLSNSYGGIQGLLQNAQKLHPSITRNNVINFLFLNQKACILHKNTKKKLLQRKTTAPRPGVIASCDLEDMSLLTRYNNGYKYIFVFIDIFSRFA